MLVINYNGNKPTTDYFKYSVQGNNNADTIRFLVSLNQEGLVFDNTYHIYAKVQCDDDSFYDKVELSEVEFDDSENLLVANFHLESKHTSHKQIEVSLCCENIDQEIVWQTQIVKVGIANGIPAEEEIAKDYPTVLAQLQQQIDELKQGGGSGGSTEVEIKRVWLSYDDKCSIRSDFLGGINNTNFINDSTRIWYNFETTPISSKMEEEIKNGRFVIRLDYPLKYRSKIFCSASGEEPCILSTPTKKQGVGTRGYLHSFNEDYYRGKGIKFRDILLRSLIFINESDIKVNDYGEKYIHKKIILFDYINRTCEFENEGILSPITNEWINNDPQGIGFFEKYLDNVYFLGIPHTFSAGKSFETDQNLFAGTKKMKMYVGLETFPADKKFGRTNSSKLNPAFSCYTLLKCERDTTPELLLSSPYYVRSGRKSFLFQNTGNGYFLIKEGEEPRGKKITRKAYMSARPRCAILNDDYENSRKAFVRTYPQSEQQIRLFCKIVRDIDDFGVQYMPIFRTLITQK